MVDSHRGSEPGTRPEELDEKLRSTIISLGGESRIYYSEQGNDLVRSIVDSIRRLSFGGSDKADARLVEGLVETLRGIIEECQQDSGEGVVTVERRPGLGVLNGNGNGNGKQRRGESEMTIRPSAQSRKAINGNRKTPEEGIPESSPEEEEVESLSHNHETSVPLLSPSIPLISFPLSSISHPSSIRTSELTPISYETILPSLFLLNSPEAAVRRSYDKFLIGYLKVRTAETARGGKEDEDEVEFLKEVARGIWTLVNPSGTISGVEATDYSALQEISSILLSTTSAQATIEFIPMLLNLGEQTHTEVEKEHASRELVRSSLRQVGDKWGELATTGTEQKFDRKIVINSLARSETLQNASGMERDKLEQVFGREWSSESSGGRIGCTFLSFFLIRIPLPLILIIASSRILVALSLNQAQQLQNPLQKYQRCLPFHRQPIPKSHLFSFVNCRSLHPCTFTSRSSSFSHRPHEQ